MNTEKGLRRLSTCGDKNTDQSFSVAKAVRASKAAAANQVGESERSHSHCLANQFVIFDTTKASLLPNIIKVMKERLVI